MALRAPQFDQAAATDRGVDIHVCSVDIRVDVRPGRVFNGPDTLCVRSDRVTEPRLQGAVACGRAADEVAPLAPPAGGLECPQLDLLADLSD